MKKLFQYIVIMLFLYGGAGCGGFYPETKDYPTSIMFQTIDLTVSGSQVSSYIEYYSNTRLSTSNNDKNFLAINEQVKVPLSRAFDSIELDGELLENDQLNIVLNRFNGEELISTATIQFLSITGPLVAQTIDHSIEDIVVEWQSVSDEISKITLKGDCIRSPIFHNVGEDNFFVISAGALASANDLNECDVTLSVFHILQGEIDPNFAGGEYNLEIESSVIFHLIGLTE